MRTPELLERLRRHYIKPGDLFPGGVFLPEVGWNGGGTGRVDALYVGFTSTSGRRLIGHELKVSRADWRHELEQQGKADPWHDECHGWFVVAPSEQVVPREEVPAGWGLMVVGKSKTRLTVVLRPTYRERDPSWQAVRSIVARQDTLRAQAIAAEREAVHRRELAADARERELRRGGTGLSAEDKERLALSERIERAFGVELAPYVWTESGEGKATPEEVAAALKVVRAARRMSGGRERYVEDLVRRRARDMLAGIDEFSEALRLLRNIGGGDQ